MCMVVFTKYHLVLCDDAVYRWLDLVFRCFDQVSTDLKATGLSPQGDLHLSLRQPYSNTCEMQWMERFFLHVRITLFLSLGDSRFTFTTSYCHQQCPDWRTITNLHLHSSAIDYRYPLELLCYSLCLHLAVGTSQHAGS